MLRTMFPISETTGSDRFQLTFMYRVCSIAKHPRGVKEVQRGFEEDLNGPVRRTSNGVYSSAPYSIRIHSLNNCASLVSYVSSELAGKVDYVDHDACGDDRVGDVSSNATRGVA